MSSASGTEPGSVASWPPAFRGGVRPVAAFALAFSLLVVVTNGLLAGLLGPDPPLVARFALSAVSSTVQVGIAAGLLRREGVGLREVGLDPRLLAPAVVAVAALVAAINATVAALAALGGGDVSVGFFALYRSPPQDYSVSVLLAGGVTYYLFVGPAEELAFRGYLQNKLVALQGRGTARARTAVGVVGAAVVFSLLHVPTLLFGGATLGESAGTLVLLALSGIGFGTVYAATRNLYLVALLHGIGNWWPLFVDPPGVWPDWGVLLVLYALLVVAYRQWAARTPRPIPGVDA